MEKSRTWSGNPLLEDFLVPIGDVKPNPGNPRRHLKRDVAATAASLEEHGQQEPIVVSSDMVLLAGEGRWLAAQTLGWSHIAVLKSSLTDAAAQALYTIRDNRLAEMSGWDVEKLSSQLRGMSGAIDLASTGLWAPYELEALLSGQPSQARNIALTVEQREVFERALERMRETDENANADALVRTVSEAYLAQQEGQ